MHGYPDKKRRARERERGLEGTVAATNSNKSPRHMLEESILHVEFRIIDTNLIKRIAICFL